MDDSYHVEKWIGRVLLVCGIGLMVLISMFAISIIADPAKLRDPFVIAGFIGGFMVLTAPIGLLTMVLPFLRRFNARKSKVQQDRQFSWMNHE